MASTNMDWYSMWSSLGTDMQKHDELLMALGELYKSVYLDSQKNRPKGMEYWDFVVGDIHGIRVNELVKKKEEGYKVIGTFCLYVPEELILAMKGICIGLCGGTHFSYYAVNGILPENTCSLIKSALGFSFGKICPYYQSVDLLVGETTCDGKKMAWEILADNHPLHVIEVPQKKNTEEGRTLYYNELLKFIRKMESLSGSSLTVENLKDAIEKVNKKRLALKELYDYRKHDPVPISGKDALLVSQVAFYDDVERQVEMITKLNKELSQRVKEGISPFKKGTPRILIAGTPMAIPNWKLHNIVETSGGVVVCEETCTGTRYFENLVDGGSDSIEGLLNNIVDRYLGINCACFTPNSARLDNILQYVEDYHVDGVILNSLYFCQLYDIESLQFSHLLKEKGIPVLSISTDYSGEDDQQLKTRIEAFIEQILANRSRLSRNHYFCSFFNSFFFYFLSLFFHGAKDMASI